MEYTKKEEKKAIKDLKSFLKFLEETYITKGKIYLHIEVLVYNRKNLDIILNLLKKQQKEIDCLKNHVHYIKCKNCNKEIRTKRSDTKYCSECSKKVSNKNYINNLSEEQKEKRRMKARETMRKIRAGR